MCSVNIISKDTRICRYMLIYTHSILHICPCTDTHITISDCVLTFTYICFCVRICMILVHIVDIMYTGYYIEKCFTETYMYGNSILHVLLIGKHVQGTGR